MSVATLAGKLGTSEPVRGRWMQSRRHRHAYEPIAFADLVAQWRADSLALSDGTAVSSWPDSSINGRTASQVAGAQQPLFKVNQFGNLPGLQFDAVDDNFSVASASALTNFTILAVLKGVPAAEHWLLYNFADSGATRFSVFGAGTPKLFLEDTASVNQSSGAIVGNQANPMLIGVTLNRTLGGRITFYEGLNQRGTEVGWAGTSNFTFDRIGVPTAATIGAVIGEIAIFSKALSPRSITDLWAKYYWPKYGAQ